MLLARGGSRGCPAHSSTTRDTLVRPRRPGSTLEPEICLTLVLFDISTYIEYFEVGLVGWSDWSAGGSSDCGVQ